MRQVGTNMTLGLAALAVGACAPAPPPATAPPAQGAAASDSPAVVSADALSAIAARMTARRTCEDTCCVGELPVAYERASPGGADAAHAPELRAIVDSAAPAPARGVAAVWLARALDVSDIPRLSRCVDETEPAGVFPTVLVGQMVRRCEHVAWEEKTLGRACLDAIGRIMSREFADPAELRAWLSTHGSPLDSYDYWQKVLTVSRPAPDDLLDSLRRRSPDLYFKVAVLDPDILGPTARPIFVSVARNQVGGDRILRLLRKQDTWPELETPDRFGIFATTVLRQADAIFEPRHGAELLALWDSRACCAEDQVRASLAVAVSRLVPDHARAVLKTTLAELTWSKEPVLEELARRFPIVDQSTLDTWFLGADAKRIGQEDALATAILRGLKDAGPPARPVLAALVRAKAPSAASQSVTEALLGAAIALGYAAPEPCRGYLGQRLGKGASAEQSEQWGREAAALRETCTQGALRWLRR